MVLLGFMVHDKPGIALEVWTTETRQETSRDTTSDAHFVSRGMGSFLMPSFTSFRLSTFHLPPPPSPFLLALLVLAGHEIKTFFLSFIACYSSEEEGKEDVKVH